MQFTRLVLAALLSIALSPAVASAQGEEPTSADTKVAPLQSASARPQPQPYLLTVSIKETDSGKAVMEKTYVLTVLADDNRGNNIQVRDGDRVPFVTDQAHEFHNVGTNLDILNVTRIGNALVIGMRMNSNSLAAAPDNAKLPIEHNWNSAVAAALIPGKPALVYSATDGVSGHKVEITATAQLLSLK